jgi:hypothetical protein
VFADLIVADAYDVDREPGQRLGADGVVLGLRGVVMDGAVQLEGQVPRGAVEVDDESGDELLAAKLQAQDPAAS